MNFFFRALVQSFFGSKTDRKAKHIRPALGTESLESRTLLTTNVLADAPNVDFEITDSWNSGHTAELVLVSDKAVSYSNWQLEFDYDGAINSLWNAEVEDLGGGRYRVTAPSWDQTLEPGESLAIGFSAAGPGSTPQNFSFLADELPPDDTGGGTEQPATSAPNKPGVTALIDYEAGGTTVTVNLYAGVPAESWKLYENGVLIHEASFEQTATTPQSDSVHLTENSYGVYHYQVEAINAAGVTISDEVSVLVGGASPIGIEGADVDGQALQLTIDQATSEYNLTVVDGEAVNFTVATNNSNVVDAEIVDDGTLRVTGLTAGRASLKLTDSISGEVRYVGIRVRTEAGLLPGLPDYVSIGSVSEDTSGDLGFWRDYGSGDPQTNKFVDSRYIYLNGGPINGWRNWGDRVGSYIRESLKLGMIPQFVYYNIPDGGESFETNTQHINSVSYMEAYFQDLKFALDTISSEAGDELVQMILEPDFLGYLMQNAGASASQLSAVTSAVYSSGVLTSGVDPQFDNTVTGLVSAINYTIGKYAPNVEFGWQFNLWASPGIESPIPSTGIVHLTDTLGLEAGRAAIAREAELIAQYYIEAGVLIYGADFISLDKYGLDAGAESGAANDPAGSTWFWNNDHWHNYLLVVETLTETTGREMVLWQLPVGHINDTLSENPYDESGTFDPLNNTALHYEDSAPTFFLGDTFTATGDRLAYFSTNELNDDKLSVSGNTVTWGSHIEEARDAGVRQILFGAGVGISTDSIGSVPTDDYWWITKVQQYYENPVLLDGTIVDPPVEEDPVVRISGATVTEDNEGLVLANFTVSLSSPATEAVTVNYQTSNGTAIDGEDYQAASGQVSFAVGEVSKTIAIHIVGDTQVESDEQFFVTLSNPLGATLATATGTILDDDAEESSSSVVFSVTNSWFGGFQGAIEITNNSAATINNWVVEFDFAGDIQDIWNAQIVSHQGDHYVIQNVSWNGTIAAGQQIGFGFVGSPGNVSTNSLSNFLLNGQPADGSNPTEPTVPTLSISDASVPEGNTGTTTATFNVTLSSVASEDVTLDYQVLAGTADGNDVALVSGTTTIAAGQLTRQIEVAVFGDDVLETDETFRILLSNVVGATILDGDGMGTILNDDIAPPVTPTISIADAVVIEGDLVTTPRTSAGFFSTNGNQIVDSAGNSVKITAVSWFGFESETNSPHGLWTRNYRDMMDDIVATGFNTIRLPFNNEMFDAGKLAGSIDAQANPDLVGLTPLEVLDRIVEYAGEIGLRIVLDHHRSDNGVGALNDGLWYTANYNEQRFIADWVMLAERYAGNPTVIGADLHNEPHGAATWGSGDLATDWQLAAERTGNAILAVNPEWLIIVEGIESYAGESYWWGGNLQGVRENPVELDLPNRVVYSPHAYPNSIYSQPWFSDPQYPQNLQEIWQDNWGYIYEENIAPLWLGEFGSRLEDPLDVAWMEELVDYLAGDLDGDGTNDVPAGNQPISWSFWSWNPNSGDTGGILLDDWRTFDQEKLDLLSPVQFELLTTNDESTPSPEKSYVEFTVALSEPTSVPVSVDFNTDALTATAGVDFVSKSGTLQFAPGETTQTIRVEVIGDLDVEPNETFSVMLSGASGGVIADGNAIGTITNDDDQEYPLVSIGDALVEEGDSGETVLAAFTVTLNSPSDVPVVVSYRTINGTAVAGQDYQATTGQLTFAPGETEKLIQVPIISDDMVEVNKAFTVELFNLVEAKAADLIGAGQIVDDDVEATPTGDVQVAFNVVNSWYNGFNGELVITNNSDEPLAGWQLAFSGNFAIDNLWNGDVSNLGGGNYSVAPASWTNTIPPGGSVRIGFTASGTDGSGALVQNLSLNGEPISLSTTL